MKKPGITTFENTSKQVFFLCRSIVAVGRESATNNTSELLNKTQKLDYLFTKLDSYIKNTSPEHAIRVLADLENKNLLPEIRRLRAMYEFKKEKSWSQYFLSRSNPSQEIEFWLQSEFEGSALHDSSLTERFRSAGKRCLIVGSGPFPTTALILLENLELEITCLDIEEKSCQFSQQIFRIMEFPHPVKHITADIMNISEFKDYDIILLVGLAGVSRKHNYSCGKNCIFDHLKKNLEHKCLLVIRIGYGLGQLFYPPVRLHRKNLNTSEVFHPAHLGRSSLLLFEHP